MNGNYKGVTLNKLTFTGSDAAPAELKLSRGLNLLYGASNTGKSFTLIPCPSEALDLDVLILMARPFANELLKLIVCEGKNLPAIRDMRHRQSIQQGKEKKYFNAQWIEYTRVTTSISSLLKNRCMNS